MALTCRKAGGSMVTISERIIERMKQLSMSQREFAERTGIKESTISEWKKNKTNPSSDKILGICKALDVSPEWLLSGVEPAASRVKNREYYVVDANTDTGMLIGAFNGLDKSQRDRIMGYVEAITSLSMDEKK
jgi:transcriptional regulator with XRE-family HTH domain